MDSGLKTVVLGSQNVGKTCLLNRFANEDFNPGNQKTTVAAAFFAKTLLVGKTAVRLQLWDTAGGEVFHSIIPLYYRHARAAILCYDIGNMKSFTQLEYWTAELTRMEPDCRLYLCGCKLDLHDQLHGDQRQVSTAKARLFAEAHGATFFETSARTGENVFALFNRIAGDAVDSSKFVSITSDAVACNAGATDRAAFSLRRSSREESRQSPQDVSRDNAGRRPAPHYLKEGHSRQRCFHQCQNG